MDKGIYKFDHLHPVHQTHDGFFNTVSGRKISIHEPTVQMIDIKDIAHGLSHVCRFGGQVRYHYSVAQHSILVMKLAPDHLKFAALMHDATEAYLGDVIKPLKNVIGKAYTDIEDRFERVICERFSLTKEELEAIKPYDKEALEIEHANFFKDDRVAFIGAFNSYYYWSAEHAVRSFLQYFFYENTKRQEVQHG
jgi:5'-deoxynucleotidase YfbR-like HD superfamily hydrolase